MNRDVVLGISAKPFDAEEELRRADAALARVAAQRAEMQQQTVDMRAGVEAWIASLRE